MKRVIKVLLVLAVIFIYSPALADTTIHLTIKTPTITIFDNDIAVTPCDSDNPSTGNLKITAYCAVLQSGVPSNWKFDWTPGIFLDSLNGISGSTTTDADGNPVYHFWDWSVGGVEGTTGLNEYELQPGDILLLNFVDPTPPPAPDPLPVPVSSGGGSGGFAATKPVATKTTFDTDKAFEFLAGQQKEDGTFGEELYTDWSTLALMNIDKYQDTKIKLTKYYSTEKIKGALLTDYERRAMATMSLGLNPYNVYPADGGASYIAKIISFFDGKQFGDPSEDNDDIFALAVLQNAGYGTNDKMITDDISFILNHQKADGSWDGSVDMTGAAMEAIASFAGENSLLQGVSQDDEPRGSAPLASGDSDLGKEEFSPATINNALLSAKNFLKQNQKPDGGFGNVSDTAWAMQGILALGEKPIDWINNGNTPLDYLATNQDTDGGIKETDPNNKIWETAYVLSSALGNTWNQTVQKFEQPAPEVKAVTVEKQNTKKPIAKKVENSKPINIVPSTPPITAPVKPTPKVKTESGFKKLFNKICLDFDI